jgi:hypothetical protein
MSKEVVYNIQTGEITEVDFSPQDELRRAAPSNSPKLSEFAEKAIARSSATSKLRELGLSPEEISAIIGTPGEM